MCTGTVTSKGLTNVVNRELEDNYKLSLNWDKSTLRGEKLVKEGVALLHEL